MKRSTLLAASCMLLFLLSCDKLGMILPGHGRPGGGHQGPDSVSAVVLDSTSYITWGDIRFVDTASAQPGAIGTYAFQLAPGSSYPFFGQFVDTGSTLAFRLDGAQLDGQPMAVKAVEPNQTLPCQVVASNGYFTFPVSQGGPGQYTFILYDVGKCP